MSSTFIHLNSPQFSFIHSLNVMFSSRFFFLLADCDANVYWKIILIPLHYIQVQAIVDHHHASDNARTATKVRFTEPNDAVNEDEDEGSLEKVYGL